MGPERRIGNGGEGPVEGPAMGGRGAEGRIGLVGFGGVALESRGDFVASG